MGAVVYSRGINSKFLKHNITKINAGQCWCEAHAESNDLLLDLRTHDGM